MNNKQIFDKLIDSVKSMIEVEEKPMTFDEAKAFLQVSSSTLYKLTHKKQMPFTKPNGGKVYFKKSDLITWMNSNTVKSADQIDEVASNYMINQ